MRAEPWKFLNVRNRRKVIAEPKVLIRIIQGKVEYWREK
jgi:hypothetical protein